MPKLPRQETKTSATPAMSGGRHQRQDDGAQHDQPAGAGGERRLDQLARQGAQPGAQGEEHERRILDAEQQDDALARIERVARAERRRDPEGAEDRARRSDELQPGERRHLRRDHQRQHEAEDEARCARGCRSSATRSATSVPSASASSGSAERRLEAVAGRDPGGRAREDARPGRRRKRPPGAKPSKASRASGSSERTATIAASARRTSARSSSRALSSDGLVPFSIRRRRTCRRSASCRPPCVARTASMSICIKLQRRALRAASAGWPTPVARGEITLGERELLAFLGQEEIDEGARRPACSARSSRMPTGSVTAGHALASGRRTRPASPAPWR